MTSDQLSLARQIARLAIPAFVTLIAEPLFLMADSAIVGHLGTEQLAALGVASAALVTAVGLCVFLAYGTTAVVSRAVGAGRDAEGFAAGIDGVWLALVIGALLTVLLAGLAGPICTALGAPAAPPFAAAAEASAGAGGAILNVHDAAVSYLRIAALGVPAMLVVLAVTGVLRGFQDTRTPLAVSAAGFGVNIVLNYLLVYPAGLGLAGSAIGTVLAQVGMAAALGLILVRRVGARHRAAGAIGEPWPGLRPHPARVLKAAKGGIPLLVRTLALRAAILGTTAVAAHAGVVALAAHQVSATIWSLLAFALDALAIAAQAITGRALGAGDIAETRAATTLMVRWGVGTGVLLGALVVAVHTLLPALFTPDPAVREALAASLLVIALAQPVSGYAFVLDGVLIGAGDARYLAKAQVVVLLAYVPVLLLVAALTQDADPPRALTRIWLGFAAFMVIRCLALGLRARSSEWLITGSAEGPRPAPPAGRISQSDRSENS